MAALAGGKPRDLDRFRLSYHPLEGIGGYLEFGR